MVRRLVVALMVVAVMVATVGGGVAQAQQTPPRLPRAILVLSRLLMLRVVPYPRRRTLLRRLLRVVDSRS